MNFVFKQMNFVFKWRGLQHEAMIAQQKEQLKNDIDKRLAEYNGLVDKFATRWHQLKPSGVPEVSAGALPNDEFCINK